MRFIVLILFILIVMICEWLVCSKRLFPKSSHNRKIYIAISYSLGYLPLFVLPLFSDIVDTQRALTWAVLLALTNISVKIPLIIYLLIHKKNRKYPISAKILYALYLAIIALIVAYGATFGRNEIRVEHVTITSNKIPSSFNGYKIAQFSDAHVGNVMMSNDIFKRMADTINYYNVDLIAQTGDLVNMTHEELNPQVINKLKRLKSKDGVVSVLGNHDLGFYVSDREFAQQIFDSMRIYQREKLDWKLLENQNFFVYRGDDSIAITGITYPNNLNHNNKNSFFGGSNIAKALDGVSDSTFTVMASHTPVHFDSLAAQPVDLMLSGHVHAMQFKIGDWSPAKFLFEKYSGLYTVNKRHLYVNDGFGYVLYPFRFGAKPEITIITLKPSN